MVLSSTTRESTCCGNCAFCSTVMLRSAIVAVDLATLLWAWVKQRQITATFRLALAEGSLNHRQQQAHTQPNIVMTVGLGISTGYLTFESKPTCALLFSAWDL